MKEKTLLIDNHTNQNRWITVVVFGFLLSPLIGFISEKIWAIHGSIVLGRGIAILLLVMILVKSPQLRISKYFIMAVLYYIATLMIPMLSGTNSRIILGSESIICIFFLILHSSSITDKTYNKAMVWMLYLIGISLLVSLIQEFYNPLFLVSKIVETSFSWDKYNKTQYRLSSIWSYVNFTAGGYSVMAFYAVVLGHLIEKKKSVRNIALLVVALLIYCLVSRQRWILVSYLIISSQIYRLFDKTSNQVTIVLVLLICLGILLYAGFPLLDVVQYRYLDKEVGGIQYGSWQQRSLGWAAFSRFFNDFFLLGINMSKNSGSYYSFLGRRSGNILIGNIWPFITYGIIGSIWYYMLLVMLIKNSYRLGKKTKNYGYFLMFVALVAGGFSNGASLVDPGTMVAIILMKHYEDKISYLQKVRI